MRDTDYNAAAWIPALWSAIALGKRIVTAIILHSTPKPAQLVAQPPAGAPSCSAHYHIDESGSVTQHVREARIAFHSSNPKHAMYSDAHTIGITLERTDDTAQWPDQQLLALAKLSAALRIRYGNIPILTHSDTSRPPSHIDDPANFPLLELEVAVQRELDTSTAEPRMPV